VWDVAFNVARPFFMKHTKDQLECANLRGANLENIITNKYTIMPEIYK